MLRIAIDLSAAQQSCRRCPSQIVLGLKLLRDLGDLLLMTLLSCL